MAVCLSKVRILGVEITEEVATKSKDELIAAITEASKEKLGEDAIQCSICGAAMPDLNGCLYCGAQFVDEEENFWFERDNFEIAAGFVNVLAEAETVKAEKTKKAPKEKFNLDNWTPEYVASKLGEGYDVKANQKGSRILIESKKNKVALLDNGLVLGYFYPINEIENAEIHTEEDRKAKHLGGICITMPKAASVDDQIDNVVKMFAIAPEVKEPVKVEKPKKEKIAKPAEKKPLTKDVNMGSEELDEKATEEKVEASVEKKAVPKKKK